VSDGTVNALSGQAFRIAVIEHAAKGQGRHDAHAEISGGSGIVKPRWTCRP